VLTPARGKGSWPVSRVLSNTLRYSGSHSSGPAVACRLEQPTRGQHEPRYGPPIWSCSGWGLPCRFCYQKRGGLLPRDLAAARIVSTRTVSPSPDPTSSRYEKYSQLCSRERRPSADYSLWHFPSPRGVRSLTGILLYGARTFLCASELHSDCPASFRIYFTRCLA